MKNKNILKIIYSVLIIYILGGPCLTPSLAHAETAETQITFTDEIKEHFFLGDEFFLKKDYDNALLEYTNIRQIDPAYIEGYLLPAKCYVSMKKNPEAAYFAAYALYLDPSNEEAKNILNELKNAGAVSEWKDDRVTYIIGPGETLDRIVFRVYGNGSYVKLVVDQNGGKKEFKEGDKLELPFDFSAVEGIGKLKSFNSASLQRDLESLKESIIAQKEKTMGENAAGHYFIADEYLKINRPVKALVAFETACYLDMKFIEKKNPQLITRAVEEIEKYLKTDPNNANAHFYLSFVKFVNSDYAGALSSFSYATSLGMSADNLTHSFKYSSLCKKNLKEIEANRIEKEAALKASADSSASPEMTDVMKKTAPEAVPTPQELEAAANLAQGSGQGQQTSQDSQATADTAMEPATMTKEQKLYYCYQQRKKIESAAQYYNENNIIEMGQETFSLVKLREQGCLKEDAKCPDGGTFKMNHNGYVECSIHGL